MRHLLELIGTEAHHGYLTELMGRELPPMPGKLPGILADMRDTHSLPDLADLLQGMLNPRHDSRPSMEAVLSHPYFDSCAPQPLTAHIVPAKLLMMGTRMHPGLKVCVIPANFAPMPFSLGWPPTFAGADKTSLLQLVCDKFHGDMVSYLLAMHMAWVSGCPNRLGSMFACFTLALGSTQSIVYAGNRERQTTPYFDTSMIHHSSHLAPMELEILQLLKGRVPLLPQQYVPVLALKPGHRKLAALILGCPNFMSAQEWNLEDVVLICESPEKPEVLLAWVTLQNIPINYSG